MTTSLPRSPYKGLRYYTAEDAAIFAARETDAKRCVRMLSGPLSVLMLHGRTGCGKSSFLRAALKPLLDRTDTGLWQSGTFIVVRSGLSPLRELAGAIFDVAQELKDSPHSARFGNLSEVLGDYQSREKRQDFIDNYGDRAEGMFEVLAALGEVALGTPILVIDQAEEVFTLRDNLEPGASGEPNLARPGDGGVRARVEYMNLLRTVAAEPPGVKLLISMRTEYKGLFEDELRRDMRSDAGTRLAGFHLSDLDFDGLVQAIVSPTELGAAPGRAGVYRFRYDDKNEVPEAIARRLLKAVPMGGVLPTLQIVCSRLYEQTKRSKSEDGKHEWTIQMTDLERLGKLDDQVAVHLRERLEEMFRLGSGKGQGGLPETGLESGAAEIDRTKDIDQWYLLLEYLVQFQGDGRAVTKQLSEADLRRKADELQCRLADRDALEYVDHDGIPRREGALEYLDRDGILRRGPGDVWTLGHDSLGLAIQRWAVTYKERIRPTMRMDVNSPRTAASLSKRQLFPGNDLVPDSEMPATFVVQVPTDLLWDHQIPFFAQTRGLSQRLGISFKRESRLVLPSPPSSLVLVSADRESFPPRDHRSAWTDIAVCDLFQGNGLVGPMIQGLEPLRTLWADQTVWNEKEYEAKAREAKRRLGKILEHLVNVDAKILKYDDSTESMMKLASHLAGKQPEYVSKLRYKRAEDPDEDEIADEAEIASKRTSTTSDSKEELFERLASRRHDRKVFMVGTAYGRALASHRGYVTYFDCQDLNRLMEIRDRLPGGQNAGGRAASEPENRSELFRLYQEIFSHTVWQINIPASEWRRIEHYPLVMRLAALCYFAADYIRSFPDDLVRFLYDWHANADNFKENDRVSRETVREMVQDCFQFLSFDENPRLLFNPDDKFEFSPRAKSTEEEKRKDDEKGEEYKKPMERNRMKLPSTVSAVHAELTALRKRTVDLFDEMRRQLEQLETYTKDPHELRKAEMLRGFAWANFRIYNYYDSARLMDRALRLVGKVVAETMSRHWQKRSGDCASGPSESGSSESSTLNHPQSFDDLAKRTS